MTPLLELKDIRRSYPAGDEQVEVLKGISLEIYAGEMVAIVGASGSGKSTLMNILGCLDKATSRSYCNDWGWKTVQSITRHSFRVASNSASVSRGH